MHIDHKYFLESELANGIDVRRISKYITDNVRVDDQDAGSVVLYDLLYDLNFFEPNASKRAQDASLFGEDRLVEEIRAAISELERL